ncbi:MAG: hypothetical protein BroJett042_05600 [Bacteroidota bacterium]|nr:MAG: hypothetical protein BroJett042_05600 [Bacteroidota bacterium]
MKLKLLVLIFVAPLSAFAQQAHTPENLVKSLSLSAHVPDELLALRSVVLFDEAITPKELEETQKAFQQTGIDAVSYFESNRVLAGADPQQAFARYLNIRNISFIILFSKRSSYALTFFRFNGKGNLSDPGAPGWQQNHASLKELLLMVFRFAVSNQKKHNLLINDFPETGNTFKYFDGRRSEVYTALVKSFKVAVPSMGNEKDDAQLEQILKTHFPLKYELVNADIPESELEAKGFKTIIRFMHTTGAIAREILEYDLSKTGNVLSSAAIVNNEAQLKTIPANTIIYKFYVKQLEFGNLFLGNVWDADTDWQQALTNHLYHMRQQLNY